VATRFIVTTEYAAGQSQDVISSPVLWVPWRLGLGSDAIADSGFGYFPLLIEKRNPASC